MIKFLAAACILMLSCVLHADEFASVAKTPGYGRIEIVSNYLLFSSGTSYDAEIPKLVREGTLIKIKYKDGDKWVSMEFVVAGISTKDDLCRLHSELPSRYSSSAGDTIYVKPCSYK
jgi:hypothetical protein